MIVVEDINKDLTSQNQIFNKGIEDINDTNKKAVLIDVLRFASFKHEIHIIFCKLIKHSQKYIIYQTMNNTLMDLKGIQEAHYPDTKFRQNHYKKREQEKDIY